MCIRDGTGRVRVGEREWEVDRGDLVAVPSWQPLTIAAGSQLDLFRFSDSPIFERLNADRVQVDAS